MIPQEVWVMIKSLQQQGLSIRAMARHLGIDRNTVRRALRRNSLPKYTRRAPRPSKLDAFKLYLQQRLAACPELTAVAAEPVNVPARNIPELPGVFHLLQEGHDVADPLDDGGRKARSIERSMNRRAPRWSTFLSAYRRPF
jgi:Helix-turn-helix domain